MSMNGKKHWIFPDGDLPPAGNDALEGHEALIITNANTVKASLTVDILFDDKDPVKGIEIELGAERVLCIRLDKPFGKQNYQIPFGQYSLVLHSTETVVAVFGRLDVRQKNLSYYTVQGYSYN